MSSPQFTRRALEPKISLRSQTIDDLERVQRACRDLVTRAVFINQTINARQLPVPLLDLQPLYGSQRAAEECLRNFELRALGAVHAAGLT